MFVGNRSLDIIIFSGEVYELQKSELNNWKSQANIVLLI